MITALSMRDFRGVRQGEVQGLTGLVVLVGANGSAKSTVLDALLIATSPKPGEAVARAVGRRPMVSPAPQWLFYRKGGSASVEVGYLQGTLVDHRQTALSWIPADATSGAGSAASIGTIKARVTMTDLSNLGEATAEFSRGGRSLASAHFDDEGPLRWAAADVRLVDLRDQVVSAFDPADLLTEAKAQGRADAALDLLRPVVPGLKVLEILKIGDGYGVFTTFENYSVPLTLAGDGIRSLTSLCFELAALPEGLVLLEEPEAHQHPGALRQAARAILSAAKRGIQLVLATHSLELLDGILQEAAAADFMDRTSVHRLRLTDGVLDSKRFDGEEARRMRSELEMELR